MSAVPVVEPIRPAQVSFHNGTVAQIDLRGDLRADTVAPIWREIETWLAQRNPRRVVLNLEGVDFCDGAGLAMLLDIERRAPAEPGSVEFKGIRPDLRRLLELFETEKYRAVDRAKPDKLPLPEEVGRGVAGLLSDLKQQTIFVGELTAALGAALLSPRSVRWRDALRAAEAAGVNALPISCMIGFLLGLIMAFQSAIPMRQFGAEIFVAPLVALSMLRELGPLMTAIVLAGRSGSAFAAEIGTMKVNEEVNALVTMGLDPVRFLAVPRAIAAVVMTPLLTVFLNLAALAGGLVVWFSLGFPFSMYWDQIRGSVNVSDFLGGLVKAFVFGILVAGVGCMRGLETRTGASAVGVSTTRAVVSGIVLIAVTDGVFSVVYYILGI